MHTPASADRRSPSHRLKSGGNVNRRTVAAGLAWSIPAVAAISAAPAFAASPNPRLTAGGTAAWPGASSNFYWSQYRCASGAPVLVDGRGIQGTSRYEWDGVWFPDALPHYTICNVRLTFWVALSNAAFTALSGVSGWSVPQRTTTDAVSRSGVLYYEYVSVYRNGECFRADSLSTGYNGWYGIPYGWRTTTCYTGRPGTQFRLGVTATVRGAALSYSSGWGNMS